MCAVPARLQERGDPRAAGSSRRLTRRDRPRTTVAISKLFRCHILWGADKGTHLGQRYVSDSVIIFIGFRYPKIYQNDTISPVAPSSMTLLGFRSRCICFVADGDGVTEHLHNGHDPRLAGALALLRPARGFGRLRTPVP